MKFKISLIITAAGLSTRFGSNKQLISISGKPMLIFICEKFAKLNLFYQKVITVHKNDVNLVQQLLDKYHLSDQYSLVEGADTRKKSVENGVNRLLVCDAVMIHDAARPNVTEKLIQRLIKASLSQKAVIPGVSVTDTIKHVENGLVTETIPRSELRSIQTPQIFHYTVLKEAYRANYSQEITDEAMMVEALGYPVALIEGESTNIKITYPEDVKYIT